MGSQLEVTVFGELEEKSFDELLLGLISEVGLLGEGLAHGLGLLDSYLGHVGLGHHLGDGQRGLNLEVLGVPVLLHGLRGGNGLNELVVGVDLSDGGRSHLGGLVAVEEGLTVGGLENLLGFGGENELGELVGDGSGLDICDRLLLGHKLLDDLLTLLAGGNSGVRVGQKSVERVLLLKVGMVGLDSHERGNAEGEGGDEGNEFACACKVLLVLLSRDAGRGETEVRRGRLLGFLLAFELVGLFGEYSHGNVVGTTHRFLGSNGGGSQSFLAGHGVLGEVDESVVGSDLGVGGSGGGSVGSSHSFLAGHGVLGEVDECVVGSDLGVGGSGGGGIGGRLLSSHTILRNLHEDVVSSAHVMGRVLVVEGGGVGLLAAGLELVGVSSLRNGLDRVCSVHRSHELEDSGGSNHSADCANLLN